jgi:hypothetical protein
MTLLNDRRQTMRGQSRRQAPRWWVNRNAQIHLRQTEAPTDGRKQPLILMGYTYDMSATGLSVYLPSLDCNIQDLLNESGQLDVVLSITPRQVKVKVISVRCETIVPALPDKSACIGMCIDQQDSGYPTYIEYLREFQ